MATNNGNVSNAAEALNEEWDALVRAAATVHPGGPTGDAARPAALSDAVRELHARDDAPAPDAAFAKRLWHDLVERASVSAPVPLRAERTRSTGIVAPAFTLPAPLLHVAIAAAIVLAVIGSSWSTGSIFAPFAVGSPTVSAREYVPAMVATAPAARCDPTPTPRPDRDATGTTPTAVPASDQPCVTTRAQ